MSQEAVYKLLKELGGRATTKQIRELALKKYPTATLYTYVIDRLRRLEKFGYIKKTVSNNTDCWTILRKLK
jgi:Fe2+ or Zn2+ uptake regulation protein